MTCAIPELPLPPDAITTERIQSFSLEVSGLLRPYVKAMVGVEIGATGPLPFAIAPHESLMLTIQHGRDANGIEQKGCVGENTTLTGIRLHTGRFTGAGDCVTLFALLTPLGAFELLDGRPLATMPRIRASVAELLDARVTRSLELQVAQADSLEDKLRSLGAWLEGRAAAHRDQTRGGLRAARAAMRLCAQPNLGIQALADEQHVGRRQLERDFSHWLGTSPRHLSQVARVQAVSRQACTGASLADISADVGFADQAHMSRVVRQMTGLTPKQFTGAARSPVAQAFRRATGGATVYL